MARAAGLGVTVPLAVPRARAVLEGVRGNGRVAMVFSQPVTRPCNQRVLELADWVLEVTGTPGFAAARVCGRQGAARPQGAALAGTAAVAWGGRFLGVKSK